MNYTCTIFPSLPGYRFYCQTLHFRIYVKWLHVFVIHGHVQLQRCDGAQRQRSYWGLLGTVDDYADGQVRENASKRSDNGDQAIQTRLLSDREWIFPRIVGNLYQGKYDPSIECTLCDIVEERSFNDNLK